MGFWEGETCEYCGGNIVERRVTLHRQSHRGYVIIESVPCGVCSQCGTRYYAADVLKAVEETIRGRQDAQREITVPVYVL